MIKPKVIYLASGRAKLKYDNVVYNDMYETADLKCDMLQVDLNNYDIILASPPCNYYSRARGSNPPSDYAKYTKHLLPTILNKVMKLNKPFIIENVRNKPLFKKLGLFNLPCFVYFHGRHTYWTNIMLDFRHIAQTFDFKRIKGYGCVRLKKYVQGGENVNNVFDYFIEYVIENNKKELSSFDSSFICE